MSLAKFRQLYPLGSLVSELVEIDRGTYIVQASIHIDGTVVATALAGASQVETAEDRAQERALACLCLDSHASSVKSQINSVAPQNHSVLAAKTEQQTTVPPSQKQTPIPLPTPQSSQTSSATTPVPESSGHSTIQEPVPESAPIVNFSEPQSPQIELPDSASASVENTAQDSEIINAKTSSIPEEELVNSGSSEHNLFGDTYNATIPESVVSSAPEPIGQASKTVADVTNSEVEAMDFNEIKQKTDIEIRRLGWTKDQGKEFLMSHYGKRSRLHLTDEQLLEFLRYLEKLPNPIK